MSRPTNRPISRAALVAAGLALTVVLASCGVSASTDAAGVSTGPGTGADGVAATPGSGAYLSQAAAKTADETSFKMSTEIAITGVSGMGTTTLTSEGEFDTKAKRGRVTQDLSSILGQLGSTGMHLPEGAGTTETIVDGDVIYLKSSLLSSLGSLTGGDDKDPAKPWIKIDASKLAADHGSSSAAPGGGLSSGGSTDPTALLDFLTASGDGLKELGNETVRGVATRHVGTNIDLTKALADASKEEREALEQQLGGLGASGELLGNSLKRLPVEAWIDADGHVRRFSITFDFSTVAKDVPELGKAKVTSTVELYDFGKPVDIEIPDPSQVSTFDLDSLLGGN